MRPEAIAAVRAALEVFGNPSSVHAAGRAAREVLDRARAQVAAAIGAAPADVVFTSGATESAAIALRGVLAGAPPGRRRLVVTAVEHPCVLSLARALERSGTPLTVVPVDRRGLVDPGALPGGARARRRARLRDAREQRDGRPPARPGARRGRARGGCARSSATPSRRWGRSRSTCGRSAPTSSRSPARSSAVPAAPGALWVTPGLPLAPLARRRAGARPPTRDREPARRRGARRGHRGRVRAARGGGVACRCAPRSARGRAPRRGPWRARERRGRAAPARDRLRDVRGLRRRGAPHGDGRRRALRERGIRLSLRARRSPRACCSRSGSPRRRPGATIRFSLGWTTTAEDVDAALRIVPPLVERVRRAIPA